MKTSYYLMVTGKDVANYDPMDHMVTLASDSAWVGVVSANSADTLSKVAKMQGLKKFKIVNAKEVH